MQCLRTSVLMVLLLLWSPGAIAGPAQELVDTWLARPDLKGVSVGVSVRDIATGEVLAAHQSNQLMNPASGAKLLTTSAALLVLGPEHRWTTRVMASSGALRLIGGGNPALLGEGIASLASETARQIEDRTLATLVVDTSRHDEQRVPPAFDQKETDASYRPAVGPAGSHYGAVEVSVGPAAEPGRPLEVDVRPGGSAIRVVNRGRTVFERAPDTPELSIHTTPGHQGRTRVVVTGALVVGTEAVKERLRVPDPDAMTGYLLRDALKAQGIGVRRAMVVVRPDAPVEVGEAVIAVHKSAPLAEIVRDINVWSNNYMAEALMKELSQVSAAAGQRLSWSSGAQVVTDALTDLGLKPEGLRVVNGSGLYRGTHVSADSMTDLLVRMASHPKLGEVFRSSLGFAGGEGWLRRRLTGASTKGRVQAKTGTLDEVVSLSGFAPIDGGAQIAFSVLVNDATPARTRKLRRAIDALVTQIVQLR